MEKNPTKIPTVKKERKKRREKKKKVGQSLCVFGLTAKIEGAGIQSQASCLARFLPVEAGSLQS